MKKIMIGLTLLASLSTLANSDQKLVHKRIDFDKAIYTKAIQMEDESILYKKVYEDASKELSPKDEAKQILLEMVELREAMEKAGNRDDFSGSDHLKLSIKLKDALLSVKDLNFKNFARNLEHEFNVFLMGLNE